MSLSFVEAHPAGFSDVAYIENQGKVHLVTCGKNGKLCFRSADKPAEVSKSVDAHADGESSSPLTSIVAAPSGERVAIADEQNFVKIFNFPGGELHTIATRFTLPARCLAYSPSGINLAASGDDEGIKLIDLVGNKVFRTLRSDGYTRGLAYDPEGAYLAAASADGTFTVWNMTTGKADFTKKKACSKIDPLAPTRLLPAWHPDGGSFLAAPTSDGSIAFYERLSWENAGELTGQHTDAVHLLAFSKNGLYLASTAADQSIVIWNVVERVALIKKVLPGVACGLSWHPTDNALSVITEDGQISVWAGPVPASLPGPTADIDAMTGVKKKKNSDNGGAGNLFDDQAVEYDDDDGDDNGGGDGSGDEYDREDSFLAESPNRSRNPNYRSRARTGHTRGGNGRGRGPSSYTLPAFSVMDLPQPQLPIQPGSTAMDAGRRYLSYTSTAVITLRSESDHNTVEVAFHDIAKNRRRIPLLTDFFGFTLGSLGEHGALYASPASSDAPSTVVYRPFDQWAPNSDWSFGLPAGEEASCIAAGANFVAVATTSRMLRLFSTAGLQTAVLGLVGVPVAMAARGGKLAVAWHAAPPTPSGDQGIDIGEYAVQEQRLLRQTRVSLSPGASLTWVGYSEEGMLTVYDSEGVLRVLSPEFGGAWVPIFSAAAERKGGEHFWVFSVSVKRAEVQCIVCANAPEPAVPSGSARPVVTAAPLRIPVVAHDDTQTPLEAEMLRQGLIISNAAAAAAGDGEDGNDGDLEIALQAAQMEADRAGLRLFTRLAQTDKQARALDVAAALHTSAGLLGAVKIANHHRMSTLAEAVNDIILQRAAAAAAQVEEEREEEYGGMYAEDVQPHCAAAAASPGFMLGSARKTAAAGGVDDGDGGAEGTTGRVLMEKGSPNGTAAAVGGKSGGGTAAADGAGVKRKAAAAGNPFARKKSIKK